MKTIQLPALVVQVANLRDNPVQAQGQTLRELMQNLCEKYAGLRSHLFYDNDTLKDHFLFTAGGELIDPDAKLPAEGTIEVMLASSGGHGESGLSNAEVQRYVRHITLPGVGRQGQQKLKDAKVLMIGTGGLGSPASLYLAAAGVGTLGLVDFDVVDESNLQRQVVHGTSTVGMPKVESAKRRLQDLNAHIDIQTYDEALNADNASSLIGQYDLVVDGTDNFATRYLINDTCVQLHKPLVYGSIYRFDGQVSVFNHGDGPCYRCLFPNSPPPELSPSCSAGGVIGVLPGVVGLIQATEAVKLILGLGEPLVGRLLRFDAMAMRFDEIRFGRRPACPSCSPDQVHHRQAAVDASCSSAETKSSPLPADFYIEPQALKSLIERGDADFVLLDVRDSNELEVCQLPAVQHIPLLQLNNRLGELDRSRPHFLVCYGGVRAERAANTLIAAGFANPRVLKGGMKRWVREVEPDMPIY